ncbi:hypothetical protein ACIP2Z_06810 [Streptomyces iakyrus]|uniref:ATP-binding protein n=1 Tax=Streptomyces iakyrus TaxID=68219 RepID=A0ABW8F9F2_9ACTN
MASWHDFGLRQSPYDVRPLRSTREGSELLVGRDEEARRLSDHLKSSTTHATIEGDFGVGKTSLASVVAYRLRRAFIEQGGPPFLPLQRRPFQPDERDTNEGFAKLVILELASTLAQNEKVLKEAGYTFPSMASIRRSIENAEYHGTGIGSAILGFGGNFFRSSSPNTSDLFTEAGVPLFVDKCLSQCFPDHATGGVICILDNLEMLEKSPEHKVMLESLRDTVFGQEGLHWVMCGTDHVIRTVVSTPMLQGRLAEPISLQPISDDYIGELVARRINFYSDGRRSPNPPVGDEEFRHIYEQTGRHLRQALKAAEDFTRDCGDAILHGNGESRIKILDRWLREQATRYYNSASARVTSRAWQVFAQLAQSGGRCTYSQYKEFNLRTAGAMRDQIQILKNAGLVEIETIQNRHSASITSKGWWVALHFS